MKSVPDNIQDSKLQNFRKREDLFIESKAVNDQIKKTRPEASRGKDYVDVDLDLRAQLQ